MGHVAPPGKTWAIFAAGGTAGHVVPALAAANALVERAHDARSLLFVGSRRAVEARMVPEAGYPVVLLPGRGIARRLTPANIGAIAGLLRAFVQAIGIVARHRPRVVVSFGGYAGAPCALAAILLRVPLVLAEQNAVPTATHRLVARFARASAVSFPGTPVLPRATVTGNPVRADVLAVDTSTPGRTAARAALGLPSDATVILAMGGSLGARRINEAVLALAEDWSDRHDVAIRHSIGERDWDLFHRRIELRAGKPLLYQALRYEDEMPEALAACDLVVGRAGGATVAEVAIAGRASILVPLPIAPYDHQTHNARPLVDAGAAVLVPDSELTPKRLREEVARMLAEPARLASMGEAARHLAHPDAAARVADVIEQNARG